MSGDLTSVLMGFTQRGGDAKGSTPSADDTIRLTLWEDLGPQSELLMIPLYLMSWTVVVKESPWWTTSQVEITPTDLVI